MNWRLLAIPASIVPLLIMVLFTHVSPSDIFKVGIVPFILSAMAVIGKIFLQAFRFKYFIRKFIGHDVSSTGKTISARLAGEFVTQTTPSYVGGELVRIAWLTKNGVVAGKAAWVTTLEIITDVFVGTLLAFIAGAIAIYHGGYFVGLIVILISIPTFVFWFLLIFFSARRTLRLPFFSVRLIQRFLSSERAEKVITSTNAAIGDLCQMSRQNFNSKAAVRTFAVGILITVMAFVLQGASFMVLVDAVGPHLGLFESLMATSASTALSNLPITIGGSGLAELGIWAYISNLNGIPSFHDVIVNSHLNVIIAWRIASYHVPLVITWIALMKLAIGKISIQSPIIPSSSSLPASSKLFPASSSSSSPSTSFPKITIFSNPFNAIGEGPNSPNKSNDDTKANDRTSDDRNPRNIARASGNGTTRTARANKSNGRLDYSSATASDPSFNRTNDKEE